MTFVIADTFAAALARLPAQEQKAVKLSVMDLQLNPASPGLQMHRIDKSKDANFWSARVNSDLRLIVHRTAGSTLLVYVDHHDKAYAWAEKRRIETHPRTGAVQIVEVRQRVEEEAPQLFAKATVGRSSSDAIFTRLSHDDLLSVGVPADWIEPVRRVDEDGFLDMAAHLPAEAAEALLDYVSTGRLAPSAQAPAERGVIENAPTATPVHRAARQADLPLDDIAFMASLESAPQPAPEIASTAFDHPDAQRRFRRIDSEAELIAALDAPWEAWSIFLHPSQRSLVERRFTGPARAAGSAGTGKSVVAVHRAEHLARIDPGARVLLTTFSDPLADTLTAKLAVLEAQHPSARGRVTVAAWEPLGDQLHELTFGRRPRIASKDQVRRALTEAAKAAELSDIAPRFLFAEFNQVIDAWGVESLGDYAQTPRMGRRTRLGSRQRERLWPVFAGARGSLSKAALLTWPQVFRALAAHFEQQARRPFDHVVVDEAQDLGPAQLRFIMALAAPAPDAVFFAGDLGQRIFVQPFSWLRLGADVRGRSFTLKVNYRTSEQIRAAADRLLPSVVRDTDEREEDRQGTISVFQGPPPRVVRAPDAQAEITAAAAFVREAVDAGVSPSEIAIFVRDRPLLDRARAVAAAVGLACAEPGDAKALGPDVLRVGTMHLAKGLEFKTVVVMACDADALPLAERISAATDAEDLDEIYETERHLLYVAATRARDRLMVSGIEPASEFLGDLEGQ